MWSASIWTYQRIHLVRSLTWNVLESMLAVGGSFESLLIFTFLKQLVFANFGKVFSSIGNSFKFE